MLKYSKEELLRKIDQLAPWYHKINLGHGIITPGKNFDDIWHLIRTSRSGIDYKNKNVLDVGSFDGMFAFEAEQLGAAPVVATDIGSKQYKNFLFCKEVLNSDVIPFYNVNINHLYDQVVHYVDNTNGNAGPHLFDIVQYCGVLYHLRDPMLSLTQIRNVMKPGGTLLVETAVVDDEQNSYMLFNGNAGQKKRIYSGPSNWWAPTILCLHEMLEAALLRPVTQTQKLPTNPDGITRACVTAEAITSHQADELFASHIEHIHRYPEMVYLKNNAQI